MLLVLRQGGLRLNWPCRHTSTGPRRTDWECESVPGSGSATGAVFGDIPTAMHRQFGPKPGMADASLHRILLDLFAGAQPGLTRLHCQAIGNIVLVDVA